MAVNKKKYSPGILLCIFFVAQWALFGNIPGAPRQYVAEVANSALQITGGAHADTLPDSVKSPVPLLLPVDSLSIDSLAVDSLATDTLSKKPAPFLDDIVTGSNTDSLIYDVRSGKIYAFKDANITYQNLNIVADYLEMDMRSKLIFAHGMPTDSGKVTRPVFKEDQTEYVMDTITYNITTKKGRLRNLLTHEGEGIMRGAVVKKMPDNTINVAGGKYTTCDADHPHYYINMTRAKVLPGKKAVFGPSYFVMEDVPIYFLGMPFGFFPLSKERSSGFLFPTFGEEVARGFFLRDGGYYYAPNDYFDGSITAGIYTLGSWESKLQSRYVKKYTFTGSISADYGHNVFGDRGSTDFSEGSEFRVMWTHSQDPKFRPNSTFSASVNFSTSGYNRNSANSINDYITNQTNSSISYSKNWTGSQPMSFSTNVSHSQSNRDTTVTLGFPSFTFNIQRVYPFRRKEALGKQKWYEKVTLNYNTTFSNTVTVKERDLFTPTMYENMKNGMNHVIPVTTALSLFNYINITPSFNYQERWYFDKITKQWDPEKNAVVVTDTTRGFYRVYNYSYSASFQTRVFGMYQFKKGSMVSAIRHVLTPTAGISISPDFSTDRFGYYRTIQTDSLGTIGYYSPFERGIYGVPGRGQSASLSFGLNNNLEMKVRSKADTAGYKKISVFDNLGASGSYNFLADSLNFSTIAVQLRSTIIKDFGINLSMVYDLYQVVDGGGGRPVRINRFLIEKGQLARLVSVGTAFGYNFSGGQGRKNPNAINSANTFPAGQFDDPTMANYANQQLDPAARRMMMSSLYYDFSIPYNFGFNYNIGYSNNGLRKQIVQTLGFNTSVNLTSKWAITWNGGYDFDANKLTPGQFMLTRDLHCWQMHFSWLPIGRVQSWSFNISIKSALLKDLKYDKSRSFYDNQFDF